MAGVISEMTFRTPSSVKLRTGEKRKPTFRRAGTCIRNWAAPPINVPIAIPIMAHCAESDGTAFLSAELSHPPPLNQYARTRPNTMEATLKTVDADAG